MGPDILSAPLEPQILSSTNTSAQKTEPDVAPTVEGLECSFIYRGTMLVHRLSPSNLPSFSSVFSLPLHMVFITMATDHARTLYTVMYRIQFSFFFLDLKPLMYLTLFTYVFIFLLPDSIDNTIRKCLILRNYSKESHMVWEIVCQCVFILLMRYFRSTLYLGRAS